MPIKVNEAIDTDTAELITVIRVTGSAYIDGIYTRGTETTLKMLASVQPLTGRELQALPEGERAKELLKFISKRVIFSGDDRTELSADIVVHDNKRYKIINSGNYMLMKNNYLYNCQFD